MKTVIALVATFAALGGAASARQQKPDTAHHEMAGLTDGPFVQMMSKHHQHGIDMARLEEERGASASVKQLAAKIRQSQEKELAELRAHAKRSNASGSSDLAAKERMMEQQGQAMMSQLKAATGSALDHAFLEQMARHHEMAISMTEGAKLQDAELKKLGQKMIAGQRRELAELKAQMSSHGPAKE